MFKLPSKYTNNQKEFLFKNATSVLEYDRFVFEYALRTSENTAFSFLSRYEEIMSVYNNKLYKDIIISLNRIMDINIFCIEYALFLLESCSNPFLLCKKFSLGYKKIFQFENTLEGLTEKSDEPGHKEWKFLALYSEMIYEIKLQKKYCIDFKFNNYSFNKIKQFIPTHTVEEVMLKYIRILSYRNIVVRRVGSNSYFFDENGIYCVEKNYETEAVISDALFDKFGLSDFLSYNYSILKVAITKMDLGMCINDFVEIYKNTKLKQFPKEKLLSKENALDKMIHIDKPVFFRNLKKRYIEELQRVEVDIRGRDQKIDQDMKIFLQNNRKEIIQKILEKLKKNSSFKRYNVLIEDLELEKVEYLWCCIRYTWKVKQK